MTEQQGNNGKVPTNEAGLKAQAPSPFALGRLSQWCLSSLPKVISTQSESCSVMSDSLQTFGLYSPWNSLGQNTGVGSLSFLQGIFPTQGLNPGLPHCRQILYQLNHQRSPRILKWAAYPFPIRSSRPRTQTEVSCMQADSLPTELPGKPFSLPDSRFHDCSPPARLAHQDVFPRLLSSSCVLCRLGAQWSEQWRTAMSWPPAKGHFPSQGLTQLLWVHRELIAGVPPEAEMPALSPHGWGSALILHGCLSPGRENTGGNTAASLFHFPFFPRTGPRRSRQ